MAARGPRPKKTVFVLVPAADTWYDDMRHSLADVEMGIPSPCQTIDREERDTPLLERVFSVCAVLKGTAGELGHAANVPGVRRKESERMCKCVSIVAVAPVVLGCPGGGRGFVGG